MSATHAAAAPAYEAPRTRLLGWIAGGALLATALVVAAIALWPASAADKAYDDGEQLGAAVVQLLDAQSPAEAEAALVEVGDAVAATRDHAGDAVAAQAADQRDALARAVDGFVGTRTSTDAFDVDLYQAELNAALDDLESNADDFRAEGPEVQQAFWNGYEDALAGV